MNLVWNLEFEKRKCYYLAGAPELSSEDNCVNSYLEIFWFVSNDESETCHLFTTEATRKVGHETKQGWFGITKAYEFTQQHFLNKLPLLPHHTSPKTAEHFGILCEFTTEHWLIEFPIEMQITVKYSPSGPTVTCCCAFNAPLVWCLRTFLPLLPPPPLGICFEYLACLRVASTQGQYLPRCRYWHRYRPKSS